MGNFRVTRGRHVAILDRGFQLELSAEVQRLVEQLLNPMALFMNPPENLVDQVIRLNGIEISTADRRYLIEAWRTARGAIIWGEWQAISSFLVELRTHHVRLPLEVRLIFKNLNSLQHMARKAGFANLMEAYRYQVPGMEGGGGPTAAPAANLSTPAPAEKPPAHGLNRAS